jgi:hypothetical protein
MKTMQTVAGLGLVGAALLSACGSSREAFHDATLFPDAGIGEFCALSCSSDFHSVVDCQGKVVKECAGDTGCSADFQCLPGCDAARSMRSNVGCEFLVPNYHFLPSKTCLAAYVVNTWHAPIAINVEYRGRTFDGAPAARIPRGSGGAITYESLPNGQVPPGEVAILFLNQFTKPRSDSEDQENCPDGVETIAREAPPPHTALGNAFRIVTSAPVTVYDIFPFGGGASATASASLLLPTATWEADYVAVEGHDSQKMNSLELDRAPAWLVVGAQDDDTHVTILPNVRIRPAVGVAGTSAGVPMEVTLARGQTIQIAQAEELTGSRVTADKPIGIWGGHYCAGVPTGAIACDALHQQIPPIASLGNEYAAVRYRNRFDEVEESPPWRLVGVVDDTNLTYEPKRPKGAPLRINAGQLVEFEAPGPFIVRSQGKTHPFYFASYMTSCAVVNDKIQPGGEPTDCRGDPDFVNVIPTDQFLSRDVFFTDPTYPETNLVLVRARAGKEVTLDCMGAIPDWNPIGESAFEYARVDLVRGNFEGQHGCENGRHEIRSATPFALTVWGWGSAASGGASAGFDWGPGFFSQAVSYGYPGGQRLERINDVEVPQPK